MFAVIFRATVGKQDQDYLAMVETMRSLAFDKYHCLDFIALTEGDQEVAISYWNSEADIQAWHRDPQHQQAQLLGRGKWYRAYRVQVVEVKRDYSFSGADDDR